MSLCVLLQQRNGLTVFSYRREMEITTNEVIVGLKTERKN